ncbi:MULTISPECIES: hypothetical protein [Streptomyces]|uniref:PknH-like extracellular domain-containing protein n=1 Tax=Streptomyces badius TaxID=1941 RepID=A0ABQ2T193_STRBA|nr:MULTISPECIES: hypothetical protein [Streptomyces]GGS48330.1 hypothetical protein GCM10010253_23310 [Streptomyces badius]
MTCHVPLRGGEFALALALTTVLLAGCSGTADDPGKAGERDASAGASPDPGDGGTAAGPSPEDSLVPDPARLPRTGAEARDLIDRVIAGPDSFGAGVVKRSPYESDPATWPVLGEDCVWQQQKPARSVLATLTRSFEAPAEAGKGPVRLAAVVTVHRTREDAAWEMAESIEETMRCPTQQLRKGETIGSMVAAALLGGESAQGSSEDFLSEVGKYQSSELGGPHHYSWQQAQTLQFTVAVTGKGAEGRTEDEIDRFVNEAQGVMLSRLESAVEKQS